MTEATKDQKSFFRHLRKEDAGFGTLCLIMNKGDVVSAGVSLCHPLDKDRYSKKRGRLIAGGRAEKRAGGKIISELNGFGPMIEDRDGKFFIPTMPNDQRPARDAATNWDAVQSSLVEFIKHKIAEYNDRVKKEEETAG